MATIFSKIVQGEIPSYKVAETEDFLAFLDIRPMQRGHTLCIPKREVDYYFDLSPEELSGLTQFSQRVAKAIKAAIPCERVAVAVIGLEVPHAHVHLVPIREMADFNFGVSASLTPEEMATTAAAIAAELE